MGFLLCPDILLETGLDETRDLRLVTGCWPVPRILNGPLLLFLLAQASIVTLPLASRIFKKRRGSFSFLLFVLIFFIQTFIGILVQQGLDTCQFPFIFLYANVYRNPGATRIAILHPKKHVAAFIFKYFSIRKDSGSNRARPHLTTTNIEKKKKERRESSVDFKSSQPTKPRRQPIPYNLHIHCPLLPSPLNLGRSSRSPSLINTLQPFSHFTLLRWSLNARGVAIRFRIA